MIILENAKDKTDKYNRWKRAHELYNPAYGRLLTEYSERASFIESSGKVWANTVSIIKVTLEAFDMKRYLRIGFEDTLSERLGSLSSVLRELREEKLQTISLGSSQMTDYVKTLYDELAKSGPDSFDFMKRRFDVGATKVMNFLLPELFIIVDSNVAEVLKKYYSLPYEDGALKGYSSEKYSRAMQVYKDEIRDWMSSGKTTKELLSYDVQPTSIPRVIDKCAMFTRH
jgi:hypothetical protein